MAPKSRFNIDAVKAVSERSAQKMTTVVAQQEVIKNPKGAGRKPAIEKATNKVSLNLTNTELEKFNEFCTQNGMNMAAAIKYCLTKQNAL
jgi:4-aminobutyrate aminotransferase-like enzyme